ncbi:squalene--hopene cyclase [Peribacillus glennii]|uniref:Squalene--hopene cyclase n=1 Tax=Peribacillus glennii TaxID=2303991 RepID=A0A372LFW8_9BACI|nr:squalene--hopene cyclase [Peribacillus glennii]RFU65203.1 squalene--hopene cyclase [Peribacillus glennii]
MKRAVISEMNRLIAKLINDQSHDGSWDYAFETGISTDSYMIILLRSLEIHDDKLIQALVKRILSKQESNGAWKLYHDEGSGNMPATLEAYYGLLYSGYINKKDPRMRAARQFILREGGIEKAGMFTKVLLSLTGQSPWPAIFPVPIEIFLSPIPLPVNFYDFSVYARANLTPILIVGNKKFQLKTDHSPDLSDLYVNRLQNNEDEPFFRSDDVNEWRNLITVLKEGMKSLTGFSEHLRTAAFDKAKQYMLGRIEPDGTFYSYFSSTFLMIFALLSLGYPKHHSTIKKAVQGLKSMACEIDGHVHMQYTTADVWNTSLISYALQEAGVPKSAESIQKANQYLLSRQHSKYGDWVVHNPDTLPGGWGFSNINSFNPDVDDTTASLRSIRHMAGRLPEYSGAWGRGINWVFSMQNKDGGWPAFERNVDKKLLNLVPVQGAEFTLLDPSSADLTGRTLEFLGNHTNLNKNHPSLKRGRNWLSSHQERDGSWYGRWGICYIYGTWAAVTGLIASGKRPESAVIQNAAAWLRLIQNEDGGWGESCHSDTEKKYVPLGESTLTDTAWAIDALIAASDTPTPEIQAGIKYLIENGNRQDWTEQYPKGQGMGGAFYIHYHSYRYIWPILALSHYRKKFLTEKQ